MSYMLNIKSLKDKKEKKEKKIEKRLKNGILICIKETIFSL